METKEMKNQHIVLHINIFPKLTQFNEWKTIGEYYGWKIQQFANIDYSCLVTLKGEVLITGGVDELFIRIEEVSDVLAKSKTLTDVDEMKSENGTKTEWLVMDCYYGWEIQLLKGTDKARIVTSDGIPLIMGPLDEMYQCVEEVSNVFSKSNC